MNYSTASTPCLPSVVNIVLEIHYSGHPHPPAEYHWITLSFIHDLVWFIHVSLRVFHISLDCFDLFVCAFTYEKRAIHLGFCVVVMKTVSFASHVEFNLSNIANKSSFLKI